MAEDVDEDLLELRIHGIRNTPPHEMLQTEKGNTYLYRGDGLAGFSTTRRRPATDTHRVEAYSWGGLARFTGFPDLGGTADVLGRVADTLVRVVWLFLAPFGLANAAYWARTRLAPEAAGSGRSGGGRTLDDRQAAKLIVGSGPGAGTVRCLGFLMTLLFITSVTVVVFEMARPWIRESTAGEFSDLPAGATTTLLFLVPSLALGTLALLPVLARTRYLSGTWRTGTTPDATVTAATAATDARADTGPTPPETGSLGLPALAQPHFWRVGSGMARLSMAHVGGGLAWIGGILALGQAIDEHCTGRLAWNTCAVPEIGGGPFWWDGPPRPWSCPPPPASSWPGPKSRVVAGSCSTG